jgi:cysteine-rich repeat protein
MVFGFVGVRVPGVWYHAGVRTTAGTIVALTLLVAACGDDGGGASDANTQPTSVSASQGDATATTPTTTASASEVPGTDTGIASADDGESSAAETTTVDATASATDSSGGTDSTGPGTGTGVSADTGTEGTADTGDTAETLDTGTDDTSACPEGQEGCPCGAGDACDPGLTCEGGTCVDAPVCGDGAIEGGEQCDDGNSNGGDGCEGDCTPTPAGLDNCGQPGDGIWIEVDYGSASSATNPEWTYSPTPGWGEPQWAPAMSNWPYIHALNATLHDDNGVIGTSLELSGSGDAFRLFIGLVGLSSYSHATVCVEGRSYATSSSVIFDVIQLPGGCGDSGMMSNDWFDLHPTNIEMGSCFTPGEDFQALEIRATGGSSSMSLRRVRLTLHDAVY